MNGTLTSNKHYLQALRHRASLDAIRRNTLRMFENYGIHEPRIITVLDELCGESYARIAAYNSAQQELENPDLLAAIPSIGTTLIKARLSSNLSKIALSKRSGIRARQITRFEDSNYACATLADIAAIASALASSTPNNNSLDKSEPIDSEYDENELDE